MKLDLLKNDLRSLAFYTDLRGQMLRKIVTIRKDNAAADSAIIWWEGSIILGLRFSFIHTFDNRVVSDS